MAKDSRKPIPLKDLFEEYKFFSEALTKGVRTGAFAIVAALWAIFTADKITIGDAGLFGVSSDVLVRASFVCASGALLSDLLQYVAALWMVNIGIDRYEAKESRGQRVAFHYDRDNLGILGFSLYWINFGLFPVKLLLAIGGGLAFFFLAFSIALKIG